MALTPAGAELAAQHRQAQVAVRAAALRDYLRIWPLWDGSDSTFRTLVDAAVPLAREHHRRSTVVALDYYTAARRAERPGGRPTPQRAEFDAAAVAGTLYVTGRDMTRRAIAGGRLAEAAMQTALVRTSGTLGRLVLAGGRETIALTADADPRAAGYERVLSPGACDFCQSIANEGTTNGDFAAHDHCACGAAVVFG